MVIFDCDGVLVESEILANHSEYLALRELGLELGETEYVELAVGHKSHQIDALLREHHGFQVPKGFWRAAAERLEHLIRSDLVAVEGAADAVRALEQDTCVASSSTTARLRLELGVTGLLPLFDGRIFSAEAVPHPKPAPDVYLYAAREMGRRPEQCLVIEDSLPGVKAGLAAGMRVLAFTGGRHVTPAMAGRLRQSGAHGWFGSMAELPGRVTQMLGGKAKSPGALPGDPLTR
jgi:HAD superfamily hydrolase (TIGR01509 family)